MNKRLIILIFCMSLWAGSVIAASFGSMYQWHSHAAFTTITEIAVMGNKVYGLSSNSLFSVDKRNGNIQYYTKLNGLSSSMIDHIAYSYYQNRMIITYSNGQIDIMKSSGAIINASDLYLKQMNVSKQVNDICMYKDYAVLAMDFGILLVDMRKGEFSDTYYIGEESSEVCVNYVTVDDEMIYASTNDGIYYARLDDNLMDYVNWSKLSHPEGEIHGMRAFRNVLYMLIDKKLYAYQNGEWLMTSSTNAPAFRGLCMTNRGLYALPDGRFGVWKVYISDFTVGLYLTHGYNNAIQEDGEVLWLGSSGNGIISLRKVDAPDYQSDIQEYLPDGPLNNFAYRLKLFGDKLYVLPGGRWASQYKREGDIMIYEDGIWTNIKNKDLLRQSGKSKLLDFMNVAQDPNDDSHYFVTTFGTGLIEMRDTSLVQVYTPDNSNLFSAATNNPGAYTRTDGAMYDVQGNLWVLNAGDQGKNVHVISPKGEWSSFNLIANRKEIAMHTPGEIMVDSRNSQWKWIPLLRSDAGLILLQDNGTPSNPNDDKVTFRREWVDQNGNKIMPNEIRCIAQDYDHTIWIGTSSGIFAIPASVDFTSSNRCVRVVIPRNDGSQLGDYLLDNEQITAISIDGANRIWVGTASSGLFELKPVGSIDMIAYYTVETVNHFTAENSILPTDEVVSMTIHELTGEVFVGTGGGLVSYMSDATAPMEDFGEMYAYPNPVRPAYQGYITITGLMGDSEVRIVDGSGNLVKLLEGTGGTAVWDGTNMQGSRVASGVYTAFCNTIDGKNHGVVKILVMN